MLIHSLYKLIYCHQDNAVCGHIMLANGIILIRVYILNNYILLLDFCAAPQDDHKAARRYSQGSSQLKAIDICA